MARKTIERILVFDAEKSFYKSLAAFLAEQGFEHCFRFRSKKDVLVYLKEKKIDIVLIDMAYENELIGMPANELIRFIKGHLEHTKVIAYASDDRAALAIKALHAGADDYVLKSDIEQIAEAIGEAVWKVRAQKRRFFDEVSNSIPGITDTVIANSSAMRKCIKSIEEVADSPETVLICGESGTGKGYLAGVLHNLSNRVGEMQNLNLAGLPHEQIGLLLFGREANIEGSIVFEPGFLAKAKSGTLFIDEIGYLPEDAQLILLQALESGSYYPIGSLKSQRINCRIIASTSRDLKTMAKEGKFLKELFFRISTHLCTVPELRRRVDDLDELFMMYIKSAAASTDQPIPVVDKEVFEILHKYTFPGNVRELSTLAIDIVQRNPGKAVTSNSIREKLFTGTADLSMDLVDIGKTGFLTAVQELPTLQEMTKALLEEALRRTGGNQSNASAMLGVSPSAVNKRIRRKRS